MPFLLACIAIVPRIVPLDSSSALRVLSNWHRDCSDASRIKTIESMQFACLEKSRVLQRGTVALVNGTHCRAMASFVSPPVTLTHVVSDDDKSGTVLIRAIVKTTDVRIADTLEDRWKVALMWFRSP